MIRALNEYRNGLMRSSHAQSHPLSSIILRYLWLIMTRPANTQSNCSLRCKYQKGDVTLAAHCCNVSMLLSNDTF